MNSNATSISNSLLDFIRQNLLAENISVNENTSFESLGLDSFSIIEIVLFIERDLGVELPDNELTKENMHSVESLTKCIQKYLK
jgi:acyl carrier protein